MDGRPQVAHGQEIPNVHQSVRGSRTSAEKNWFLSALRPSHLRGVTCAVELSPPQPSLGERWYVSAQARRAHLPNVRTRRRPERSRD